MKRSTRFLLSIASGVLLSLAWLKFPGWILFIGFLPLLFLDHYFVTEKHRFRSVSFFGHTYLAFFIWNGLSTWWVMHATPVGAVLVIFLNSFLMSVPWWLAHIARRRFTERLGYLALVVFWLTYEFCHYHWQIEWPWLSLGNGFANNVKSIQWYEFTGVFGGSLWVLLVNILLFEFLKTFQETKDFKKIISPLSVLLLVVFIPLGVSLAMYSSYKEKPAPKQVVIVQPNIDPYNESYDEQATNEKLQKFINLAKSQADGNTDFIVGPETVFEQEWEESRLPVYSQYKHLESLAGQMKEGGALIIGASTYKIYEEGEKRPETARTSRDGSVVYDRFNAALYIGKNGESQVFHKSVLVAGVEKMPFRKTLKFLEKFIINLGGTTGSLGKQDEPTNFTASGGSIVATVICYESAFGEYLSKFVKKGAQAIFVITNDGWWKNTPGYRQHMSFSRLRAIETRRSIARSANTGISCFINQRGDVIQPTKWWTEAAIKGEININEKLTFYVKYGDYIARVAAFMSAVILMFLVTSFFRRT